MSKAKDVQRDLLQLRKSVSAEASQRVQRNRFQKLIYRFYQSEGRSHPWRDATGWYEILLSEFMLQQTQVSRVLPKYESFLRRFPDAGTLARARLSSVLRQWQGLGYNRRAKALHACVKTILNEHAGVLPKDTEALCRLPGIGSYTAAALQAFVYELPSVVVETNIKTVFIHCFFWEQQSVSEAEIESRVRQTVDSENPRNWYYALMDYGAFLKAEGIRYNARIAAYRPQAAFEGSNRQLRGQIIKLLGERRELSRRQMLNTLDFDSGRIGDALMNLEREGLICSAKSGYRLAS